MNGATRLMLIGTIAAWLWAGAGLATAQPTGDRPRPGGDRPPMRERVHERDGDDRPDADEVRQRMEERMRERRERMERDGGQWDRDDRDGRHGDPRELTDDDVENVMAVIKDMRPEAYQRLAAAMRNNPEQARRFIAHIRQRMGDLVELRQNDPDLYRDRVADERFKMRSGELARRIRDARMRGQTTAVAELTEQLRDNLEQQFEVRQKLRERKLAKVEQQLETLREEIREHADRKAELIEAALADYLGDRPMHDRRFGPRGDRDGDGTDATDAPRPPTHAAPPPRPADGDDADAPNDDRPVIRPKIRPGGGDD